MIKLERHVKTAWIERELMRDFNADGTDAYRLWTIADGWVERLGRDVLVSFKNQAARERLIGATGSGEWPS